MPATERAIRTPALTIELSTLRQNLQDLERLARESSVELWPHAKTHRMAELGRMQLANGADGLCVAKLGEAEAFADAGASRILIAYPVAGAGVPERALALARRVDLTVGTDSTEAARDLGRAFAAAGRRLRVLLAVDTGLGREGVPPADAARVASRLAEVEGIEFAGIYTHEGTAYEARDRGDLVRRSEAAATAMTTVAEQIRSAGIAVPTVSLGSSASVRTVAAVAGVTQVRPGIAAVNDLSQVALGNAALDQVAIRVLATVVSHPEPGRACIDAGSKALGSDLLLATAHRDRFPGYGLLVGLDGWQLERLSEEHGWLRWRGAGEPTALPVGRRVEIVPNHACLVFAALRRAVVFEDDDPVDVWDGFGPGASS